MFNFNVEVEMLKLNSRFVLKKALRSALKAKSREDDLSPGAISTGPQCSTGTRNSLVKPPTQRVARGYCWEPINGGRLSGNEVPTF